jgi:hypothetical protein
LIDRFKRENKKVVAGKKGKTRKGFLPVFLRRGYFFGRKVNKKGGFNNRLFNKDLLFE